MSTTRRRQGGFATGEPTAAEVEGVLDAVMKIAEERRQVLLAMKDALIRGDEQEALELARDLTDLPRKRPVGDPAAPISALRS